MEGAEGEGFQDQEIECALKEVGAWGHGMSSGGDAMPFDNRV
jgi:hypothetical protein